MKFTTFVLAIIILGLQIRLLSSEGGVGEWVSLQSKLDQLQSQMDALEKQNILLKKEVSALQSSPKAIETLARQKLGMIAEDEVFIQVIELTRFSEESKRADYVNSPLPDQTDQLEGVDEP